MFWSLTVERLASILNGISGDVRSAVEVIWEKTLFYHWKLDIEARRPGIETHWSLCIHERVTSRRGKLSEKKVLIRKWIPDKTFPLLCIKVLSDTFEKKDFRLPSRF